MQIHWEIDDAVMQTLRNKENWLGSFYELALAFAPQELDDSHRSFLLEAVWADPQMQGVVSDRRDFGNIWLKPGDISTVAGHHAYGCIRLHSGQIIGCGSCFVQTEEFIWLVLYIPLGMLELAFPVGYPILKQDNPWRAEVDEELASLGTRVYRAFPFVFGIMGEEAGVAVSLETLREVVSTDEALLVPERLFEHMEIPTRGWCSPEGLWWTGGKSQRNNQ